MGAQFWMKILGNQELFWIESPTPGTLLDQLVEPLAVSVEVVSEFVCTREHLPARRTQR